MIVTLIDGRQVDSADFLFNQSTYHITLGGTGEDITNNVRRADKIALYPNFDIEKDNARLYNEQHGAIGPAVPLNDSTTSLFLTQLGTDPLDAPLASLNKTVDRIIAAPATLKIGVIVAVVLVVYLLAKQK